MCMAVAAAAAASLRCSGPRRPWGNELVGDKVWGLDNTKAKETYLCYGQQAEYRSRHIWPAALNRTESQSLLDPAAPLCFSSWYPFSVGEEKHPQQSLKEQIYGILCQL